MQPFNQLQQARPSLSSDEIHDFLEKSRKQLDTTFAQIINTDRERSSSASSASRRSSSSKRSREDDDDSDRASKRALRRISLRNKTRAFVTYVKPASSSKGTEISFNIRVDTPPSSPTEGQGPKNDTQKEKEEGEEKDMGEKKAPEGEEHDEEGKSLGEEVEVPDTRGKSAEGDGVDEAVPPAKPRGGRGKVKSRSKNA